jgi:methionyl-tRNA synthetase
MKRKFDFIDEKKHFLVPAMPTPNGRMHLGHIAGPYLKMDVIKRKVNRNNGTAFLCSGSDVYESYVELKAQQLKLSTDEVSFFFHDLMVKDYEALNIDFDLYLNPLEKEIQFDFDKFQVELMDNLMNSGSIVEKEEIMFFDDEKNVFLNGCWLDKGECPNCKKGTGSYLCENCGTHYKPQDIFEKSNFPNAKEKTVKSLYLKLDEELLYKNASKVQGGIFLNVIKKFIELQGPYIRLTTPQTIGVSYEWDNNKGQMIFTYPALLFFSIYCGHYFEKNFDIGVNPFSKDSGFITCASFGIDSVVPFLAGVHNAGIALNGYESFDHYFSNYFYNLDGEKFSTSRLHTIWGSDIVNISLIQSDAVRYYLCKINPEFEKRNFDTYQFVEIINTDLYYKFNEVIKDSLDTIELDKPYDIEDVFYSKITEIITIQNNYLDLNKFMFSKALEPIDLWIEMYSEFDKDQKNKLSYWWLKTLAFLSYPIMPEISLKIWNVLSNSTAINYNNFFENNCLVTKEFDGIKFNRVEYSELEKSLPLTLRSKSNA